MFTEFSRALLIIHNFLIPAHTTRGILENKRSGGACRTISELNHGLDDMFQDNHQVFVLDYDHLAGVFGKDRLRDQRKFYLADMEWSDEFVSMLSNAYLGYIKPAKGILRKCIVTDLDGTLWGGILGENGFDGIQLDVQHYGRQFRDFQRLLYDLHRRGVILAINSKNNFDEAIMVIREHPYMILREKHFAAMKINWVDKVTNMREIAKDLNIGLDSMVFLDNDPAERFYMRQALPQVLTVELPSDPALYYGTIERLNDFNALGLTEEDLRRGELYATEFARSRLLGESSSIEEFLANLKMTLIIRVADKSSLSRVAQLLQRTNQFNLTTRRYTEAEIADLLASPDYIIYTLRVLDIFGDNGLVGVIVLRTSDGPVWNIDNFLLSCRVLGRRVETCFLYALVELMQKRGVQLITGEFIVTKKNEVAKGFYPQHGFTLVNDQDGVSRWELGLEGRVFELPAWMTIDIDPRRSMQ
jgi:FkbH-like protein